MCQIIKNVPNLTILCGLNSKFSFTIIVVNDNFIWKFYVNFQKSCSNAIWAIGPKLIWPLTLHKIIKLKQVPVTIMSKLLQDDDFRWE